MTTWNPAAVSCMSTASLSPEWKRMTSGVSVKVAAVWRSGSAGPGGAPLLVMNAKFTYSCPAAFRQALLLLAPVAELEEKLSMLSAAHHSVWSQPKLSHPGG